MGKVSIVLAAVAATAAYAASGASAAPRTETVAAITDASQKVTFDVFLPLQHEAELDRFLDDVQKEGSPNYHKFLTPQQFKERYGASSAAVESVRGALAAAGFSVEEHTSSLRATGPVASAEKMFGTHLGQIARHGAAAKIVATDKITLPTAFAAAGATVLAFDARPPVKHTESRLVNRPLNRNGPDGGYWYNDLKEAYDYPSYQTLVDGKVLNGQGVNIGILMSSDVLDSDIKGYFDHEKFSTTTGTADPAVFTRRYIAGAGPADPSNGAYLEISLDVEESLGSAPGAHLYLYAIPDLGDDVISGALVDVDEYNEVNILSMSFGGCERGYSAKDNDGVSIYDILKAEHRLFKQGASEGITFVASSGDEGALACPNANYINAGFYGKTNPGPFKFVQGVEGPADDPSVTGVGGTNLVTTAPTGTPDDTVATPSLYVGENAQGDPEIAYDAYGVGIDLTGGYWGAGGGVSRIYAKPYYQTLVPTGSDMRTVPDVGMQVGGCPGGISEDPCPAADSEHPDRSYVYVYSSGCGDSSNLCGLIGTSVSAPEFAGALALRVQKYGPQGNINYFLYSKAVVQNDGGNKSYHRQIPGFDGLYRTHFETKPYNYLTGNGTPRIKDLLGFRDAASAGTPRTVTNP